MVKMVNFHHPPNLGAPRRALSQARPQASQNRRNCLGCQACWALAHHGVRYLTVAFKMMSSLCMQATNAAFWAFPLARSWR